MKILAFDLGAESGRSVLGELANDRITLSETSRFLNVTTHTNGQLRWNTTALFRSMLDGLKESVRLHPDIQSVGCDTWGVDYVTLGEGDRLLEEPYCYRDARTDGLFDKAFERVPRKTIYDETGIQFMQLNTLYQFLAATLGKGPKWSEVRQLLMVGEYFHFLFSGKKVAEISLASTTQAWNPRTRQWSAMLLEKMGVPMGVMPPLVPPGEKLGPLLPSVAKACGASEKIQVIAPCSHDTGSAVAAVPAEGERWAYVSSGTWSLLGAELPGPLITDLGCELGFTNEAGLDGTIRYLKNIIGLWLVQECRRDWESKGKVYDYATLTKMASEAKPFGPLINPGDARFVKPGGMPDRIVETCRETKQEAPSTPGAIVRCALESLALEYRKAVDQLEKALGWRVEKLNIVGGGSQNQLLCQFTANALGRPVIAGPPEATALGNCLIQAKSLGAIKDLAHLRRVVRNSFPVKMYEPMDVAKWEKHYGRFRELA